MQQRQKGRQVQPASLQTSNIYCIGKLTGGLVFLLLLWSWQPLPPANTCKHRRVLQLLPTRWQLKQEQGPFSKTLTDILLGWILPCYSSQTWIPNPFSDFPTSGIHSSACSQGRCSQPGMRDLTSIGGRKLH